jgi:hypothetical protein
METRQPAHEAPPSADTDFAAAGVDRQAARHLPENCRSRRAEFSGTTVVLGFGHGEGVCLLQGLAQRLT